MLSQMAHARGHSEVSAFPPPIPRAVQLSARPVSWLPDRRSFPPSQASSPVALGKELPGHSGGPAPDSHRLPDSPPPSKPLRGTASVGTPCDVAPRLAGCRQVHLSAYRTVSGSVHPGLCTLNPPA